MRLFADTGGEFPLLQPCRWCPLPLLCAFPSWGLHSPGGDRRVAVETGEMRGGNYISQLLWCARPGAARGCGGLWGGKCTRPAAHPALLPAELAARPGLRLGMKWEALEAT